MDTKNWRWPLVKTTLSLTILALIGWRFYKDLSSPDIRNQSLDLVWLVPAALCYLCGLTLSALYWRWLMLRLEQPAPLPTAFRAYFVGQLGKYVPGKAIALVMRAGMMRNAGTSVGLAGLTAVYEVLVTMAAGALVALLLFILTDPAGVVAGRAESLYDVIRLQLPVNQRVDRLTLVLLSFGLCCAILSIIFPAVLNRLVRRVTTLFRLGSPPRLQTSWLGAGLLMTAPCWLLFGIALACALEAVPGAGLGWSIPTLAYLTAVMALAYVAGFVVPVAPGGLGIREFSLSVLLAGEIAMRHSTTPEIASGRVVLAVLLLRLAWTAAEVILAGVLYLLPVRNAEGIAQQEAPTTEVHPPPEEHGQVA